MKKSKIARLQNLLLASVPVTLVVVPMGNALSAVSRSTASFLGSLPASTTSSDVSVSASGATVSSTSAVEAGHNYREGYIEMTVANSALSGKLLTLETTRVNSITNGSFETAITSSDADSYGGWQYASSTYGSISQAASTLSSGNSLSASENNTSTSNQFYVQQAFDIEPGELYRISYKINASSLLPAFVKDGAYTDGRLEVRLKTTTTAGGSALSVAIPSTSSTTAPTSSTVSTTSQSYEKLVTLSSNSSSSQSHRFVTLECDTHTIYTYGGTTGPGQNYTSNMTYRRYNPGASSCKDVVKYGQLVFAFSSTASNTSRVELDDVKVDWERQIEAEVRDTSGNVLQRSTQESFRVSELNSTTYPSLVLRIYLRSLGSSQAPVLKSVNLETGNELSLSVTPTPTAEFTSPRMGLDLHLPPKSEFNSSTTMPSLQSKCAEAGYGTAYINCYELFSKYNLTRGRLDLPPSSFNYTAGATDYTPTLTTSGTTFTTRIKEANSAGLDPLVLLPVHSDMGYICSSSGLSVTSRPSSGTWSTASNADLAKHLFELYARSAVTYLNGSTGVGAQASRFEIFNEPNADGFESACPSLIATADLPAMANSVAAALHTARSGIQVSPPGLASEGQIFDSDYLGTSLLPALTSANFQNTNFHPYTDTYRPEKIAERWAATKSTLTSAGWDPTTQTAHIGEFGYSGAPYDPACPTPSNTYGFYRGWAGTAQGNRYAIATIENLATESESVIAWGRMNNESESSDPTCWKSGAGNKSVFERVAGTGYLSTGSHADATQYAPNSAGNAFLIIGKHLSNSSPTPAVSVGSVSLAGSLTSNEDHYQAKFYKTDYGYAAAVWYYHDYEFGTSDPLSEEVSDTYYQNYLYGARGHGSSATAYGDAVHDYAFEEKRLHDVVLQSSSGTFDGIAYSGSISGTATKGVVLVDLETLNETLVTATFSSGSITIPNVPIGERPTLILIRTISSTTYPWENLSPWYDPDPSRYNDWFIVNRDAATAPPATTGTYSFVRGHKSPQLYGGVHRTGNSNPYYGYRWSSTKSPVGQKSAKIPIYNACPGNADADYGICIQN